MTMDKPMTDEEVARIAEVLSLPVAKPSNVELAKKLWKEMGPTIKSEDAMAITSLIIANILSQSVHKTVHSTGLTAILINAESLIECFHDRKKKANLQ